MVLKAILTETDWKALPTDRQTDYAKRKGEDGKELYFLVVEGVDGWKLENTQALHNALERERESVKTEKKARKDLEDSLDGIDLEQARDALKRVKSLKDGLDKDVQAQIQAAVESATKQEREKHQPIIKEKDEIIAARDEQLREEMVDARASAAIVEAGGNVLLLLPHVKSQCKLIENKEKKKFQVKVIGADGQVRMSMDPAKSGEMDLVELVESMKKQKEFQVAFKSTGATGSGKSGANGSHLGSGKKIVTDPKDPGYSLAAMAELKRTDPAAYQQAMQERRVAATNAGRNRVQSM